MANHLESSDGGQVRPEPGLGANFEVAPIRALEYSARASVAGEPTPTDWHPVESSDEDIASEDIRVAVRQRDGQRCVYCGVRSATIELDTINDNHHDISVDNLVAADPLCHGYHHLDDLTEKDARLAYLPGLDASDVNHLQRIAIAELFHGDEDAKGDARDIINWLASHHVYTSDVFGTAAPHVLGSVLTRVDPRVRAKRSAVLQGIALIYNPQRMRAHASVWRGELLTAHERSQWGRLFQDVMRLTA